MNPTLPQVDTGSAVQWFAAWAVLLLALVLLARSTWGKPIVYYVTWLAITILVLTHSADITNLLTGGGSQVTNG